jgi:hypothetical protein
MPAINPGAGASNGPQQHQRTTFRPPWVKEGPDPLPMPTAPWTLNRSRQKGKSQLQQDSTQDVTVQDILLSCNTVWTLSVTAGWFAGRRCRSRCKRYTDQPKLFCNFTQNLHMWPRVQHYWVTEMLFENRFCFHHQDKDKR